MKDLPLDAELKNGDAAVMKISNKNENGNERKGHEFTGENGEIKYWKSFNLL